MQVINVPFQVRLVASERRYTQESAYGILVMKAGNGSFWQNVAMITRETKSPEYPVVGSLNRWASSLLHPKKKSGWNKLHVTPQKPIYAWN